MKLKHGRFNVMKKSIKHILAISFMLTSSVAFSLNADKIVAWPVPFNPNRHVLTIDYAPEFQKDVPAPDKIHLAIFDINGDKVFENSYSSLPIYWYGRNMRGNVVQPGLYIIRLIVEQSSLGTFQRRTIRVVIVR